MPIPSAITQPSFVRHSPLCLLCVLVLARPAAAQEPATLPAIEVTASNAADAAGAAPTVSTGSNLGLTARQIPASVETIDRDRLERRGDVSLVDAITRSAGVSSLAHPGNGGSSLSVRGFTDTTSVMRLYDGVRQYGGVGLTFPFDTWSVERIEVLRGPASVIYGDGAIGGVVNVVPKKPGRGPIENEIQATLGTQNTQRLALGSGGAIDEKWSYRADLSGNRSSGWVDRGDSDSITFSGALQLDVSPDLSLRLDHAYGNQHPMQYFGTPLFDGRQIEAIRHRNYNVADADIAYRDSWTSLSASWKPRSDLAVSSKLYHIDSARYYRNSEAYFFNPGSGLVDRSDNTEIAHDQQQIGNTSTVAMQGTLLGLENRFSLGVDVNASKFKHTNNTYVGVSPSVDPYAPEPGNYSSPNPFIPRYRNEARQFSLFAEDRISLTDRLSVLGGARYDHARITRDDSVSGGRAFEKTYANFGWRIGSVYDLTSDLALYGQYAKAADPVSGLLMLSPANSAFDISTGKQLEIGVKQAFWGKKGELTLAAYAIEKDKLLTRDTSNPALRVQVGKRSSRGLEATLAVAPAPGWQLDLNLAVLRARYDDFVESSGGQAVSRNGNVPTDVPQRLANAALSWDFAPSWTASGALRHVGKRYADNANSLVMPAYTTTDLALIWKVARDTTLALRGFNVFDKKYVTTAYYTTTQWLNGADRRIELTANHRF
jgi:iron complex outermembrane receptor protein